MIGKIIPRRHGVGSFRDSVNYNLGLSRNDTDKVEYVNTLNVFEPSIATKEMEAVALENKLSKNPVFNCILSWRENEIPTHAQADEAVQIVLQEMGLEECQTHYALHRNTQNLHLHICVNRIHPETYKAIDPAHGWTKKAIERAARKIEFAQGWDIEQRGRYLVTVDGQVLEKNTDRSEQIKLSQTAKDIEAHTGAKSAERIAQEVAASIIRSAKSWGELHQNLAERGIAFDKKGSGAVLAIGDIAIKTSRSGRDISLSKLEKRLGAFRDRGELKVIPVPITPEPVARVESVPKVKNAWTRYQEAKDSFFKTKKKASTELASQHKQERESLVKKQRQERSALFSVSWKGKGMGLNQRRSVMAAKQKGETLSLRERQKKEREELKRRFPQQFHSFKAWLGKEDDVTLSVDFRYPGQPVIFAATVDEQGTMPFHHLQKKYDIRDYSPIFSGRERGVMYRKDGSSIADFIDYGKKIVFPVKHTEQSVLAALQLASQKWGTVQLAGSEDYKRLCVKLAVTHNIRIANPELRMEMETTQKILAPERPRGRGR